MNRLRYQLPMSNSIAPQLIGYDLPLAHVEIGQGVFGVPTFIVGGELFWGNDQLEHIELFLQGKDPLEPEYVEEMLARHRGIDRVKTANSPTVRGCQNSKSHAATTSKLAPMKKQRYDRYTPAVYLLHMMYIYQRK